MNNQIILHREPGSVYSQKIMCVFGYNQVEWQSVMASVGMPRPEQEILVGSFARRMPILQIGADLYCDTDMIMSALSKKLDNKLLSRLNLSEAENKQIWSFDSELFYAVQGSVSQLKFAQSFFKGLRFSKAITFFKDRLSMPNTKSDQKLISRKTKNEWIGILKRYFAEMQEQLVKSPFLSGKNEPNLVDFSAFTQIFYMDFLNELKYVKNYPKVKGWYRRMNDFGIGNATEISSEKVLEIAKNTEPEQIPITMQQSKRIGQEIEVPFNDALGKLVVKPLKGILVGEDDYQYIIERESNKIGKVNIHIPKKCYGACG